MGLSVRADNSAAWETHPAAIHELQWPLFKDFPRLVFLPHTVLTV